MTPTIEVIRAHCAMHSDVITRHCAVEDLEYVTFPYRDRGGQREFALYGVDGGLFSSLVAYLYYRPTREVLDGACLGRANNPQRYVVDPRGLAAIEWTHAETDDVVLERFLKAARELLLARVA